MDKPKTKKHKKKRRITRWIRITILFFFLSILAGLVKMRYQEPLKPTPCSKTDSDWCAKSFGFAPYPGDYIEPVVQIYAARTWGAKKAVAVHTWIATKRRGADHYQVGQIIGWRLNYARTALFKEADIPDKSWYGNEPSLLLDLRGEEVEIIIDKIDSAIKSYPWANEYTAWPGPNSNTFVSWLGLQIPELQLDLPATAIGKDWRPFEETFGLSASGTGVQASFFGLLGTSIGFEEGLEINILGLSVELDIFDLALELPGIGRIGEAPVDRNKN